MSTTPLITGGGEGRDDEAALAALDFLRDKLGGFFFRGSSGTPVRDLVRANLIRLRAVWEEAGQSPPNLITGVHSAMYDTGDDSLRSLVDDLFGREGHIQRTATGDVRRAIEPHREQVREIVESSGSNLTRIRLGLDEPAPSSEATTADATETQPATPPASGDPLEARAGAGAFDDAPRTSGGTTSAGSQGSGAAGGGTPSPTPAGGGAPSTGHDHGDAALNRVPDEAELWRIDGRHVLVYKVPGTNIEAYWEIEDDERFEAIFGQGNDPDVVRSITMSQARARGMWRGGLSRELSDLHVGNPWLQFESDFEEAAELRPWLRDPTYHAINAIAYLEGRAPTTDELARTDWWNDHTEDERSWMESSATAGRAEVQRRMQDAKEITAEALRNAGTDNAPQAVIDFIAMQRLTGAWSQEKANQQVRRLTDPSAPGNLDPGVWAAWRGDVGNGQDARAISEGKPGVVRRLRQIFDHAEVPTTDEQLDRVADEVLNGRAFDDVRRSVDIARGRLGQTLPGLDTTRAEEDTVRDLAQRWLGPTLGGMSDAEVAEWAGRLRNNPDGQTEFVEHLKEQNLALFSAYDTALTWDARVGAVRNLVQNVWGQPPEDDSLLVNLANMRDYVEAEKVLRREGWQRGIQKVQNDMMSGLSSTALGEQVVRSAV